MADNGDIVSRRYRELARQLVKEEGGVRAAARRLGVHPSTFSEHLNGVKNAKQDSAANAVRRLHLDWAFFTDATLPDDNIPYKKFVGSRVVVDDDAVPESMLIWERGAPKAYDPAKHRARMLGTRFRFPPDQAWRWGSVFENVLAEREHAASDADRESMEEARRAADALGALVPPKKAPRRRRSG